MIAAIGMRPAATHIDTTGKMVITPKDFASAFVRTQDGKYAYIDRSGTYVWTPTLLYN